MGLCDLLQDDETRRRLVADCAQLIDAQVSAKKGLSGLALKTTYGVVKGIGPTYVPGAVERILPDILAALDPLWQEGMQSGDPTQFLTHNPDRTADCLLSVTDSRIAHSNNGLVKTSYNKLRQSVKGDVESAVPGLAQVLAAHAAVPS